MTIHHIKFNYITLTFYFVSEFLNQEWYPLYETLDVGEDGTIPTYIKTMSTYGMTSYLFILCKGGENDETIRYF